MGRRVKPRHGNYERDVSTIQRIATAVREDVTMPEGRRATVVAALQRAAQELIAYQLLRTAGEYPGSARGLVRGE